MLGNALLLLALYLLSPLLLPLFIKVDADLILSYFNLFLIILALSVPNEMLGFTYLGVMDLVNKVNTSSIIVSFVYLVGIVLLWGFGKVSIMSLIGLLIVTNALCLLLRLYYVKTNRLADES